MSEKIIKIDDSDMERIVELEMETNETEIKLAELELQKVDLIEIFKSQLSSKLQFIAKMKKKYDFTSDDFSLDLKEKTIKIK